MPSSAPDILSTTLILFKLYRVSALELRISLTPSNNQENEPIIVCSFSGLSLGVYKTSKEGKLKS